MVVGKSPYPVFGVLRGIRSRNWESVVCTSKYEGLISDLDYKEWRRYVGGIRFCDSRDRTRPVRREGRRG